MDAMLILYLLCGVVIWGSIDNVYKPHKAAHLTASAAFIICLWPIFGVLLAAWVIANEIGQRR